MSFKILVLGDKCVGKTTFINQIKNGKFKKEYIPTDGLEVTQKIFNTYGERIYVNIWEYAGQTADTIKKIEYMYIGANAVILMFDVNSIESYNNIMYYYASVVKVFPNIPIVLCGNKSEFVKYDIKFRNIKYYNMSCKSNQNIKEPFLYLLRKITGNNELNFIEPLEL